jgi:hypothetical protein
MKVTSARAMGNGRCTAEYFDSRYSASIPRSVVGFFSQARLKAMKAARYILKSVCVGSSRKTWSLAVLTMLRTTVRLSDSRCLFDAYDAVFDAYDAVFDAYDAVFDAYSAVFDVYDAVFDAYSAVFDVYSPVFDVYDAVVDVNEPRWRRCYERRWRG